MSRMDIRRLPAESAAAVPSNRELLRLASAAEPEAGRVLLIVVREPGPRLVIGVPALIEGGTEVVVEVRVLDGRTAESLADVRTHWRHGGKFSIKGVRTLDRDMSTALRATLMPDAATR